MRNKRLALKPEEIEMIHHLRAGSEFKERQGAYSYEESQSGALVGFTTEQRITSLAGLVKACDIDLQQWKIEKWICNKWEVGAKNQANELETKPLFQVKVWLKPNGAASSLIDLKNGLVEDLHAYARQYARMPTVYEGIADRKTLLEVSIFDAHIDKLAWHEETGENYDLRIATERYNACLNDLVSKAKVFNPSRILFPIGNDFFNTDGSENATTRGTRQDVDVRSKKAFRKGVSLLRMNIDKLSEIAPVDIVIIPGNHDEEKSWYLGEVLSAIYAADPNVTIDNSPKKRKYYTYGKNLIGFAHGDKEKPANLPSIMAHEARNFSETVYREWHLGHYHHEKVKDMIGVTLRWLRSVSGTDTWHFDHGYVGTPKAAECFLWNYDGGLQGSFYAYA